MDDVRVDNEEHRDTYRAWIVPNLGTFRDAFQPHIDQLTPYVSPSQASEPAG